MAENVNDIGGQVTLDISDYKQQATLLYKQIKNLESAFKASAVGMTDWGASLDGLSAKIQSVTSVADLQRQRMEALQAEYNLFVTRGQELTNTAIAVRTQLNNATAAYNRSQVQLQGLNVQLAALQESQSEAAIAARAHQTAQENFSRQVTNLQQQLELQRSELDLLNSTYGDGQRSAAQLEAAQQNLSQQAETQRQIVERLTAAIEESASATGADSVETRTLQTQLNRAQTEFNNYANQADDASDSTSLFGDMLKANLTSEAIIDAIKQIASAIKDLTLECINYASDLAEIQNVVDVTFADSSEAIDAWAQNAINKFGLSLYQAKQYNSVFGAMLKSSGITSDALVEMSETLSGMVGDFSSFYNLDYDEAFNKIRSAIAGEIEPVRQLGINISQTALSQTEYMKSLNKSWNEMTTSEQVLARYNGLLEGGSNAMGDFVRTSTNYANEQRVLANEWAMLQTILGEKMLPVAKAVKVWLQGLVESVTDIVSPTDEFTKSVYALSTELSDTSSVLDNIEKYKELSSSMANSSLTSDELAKKTEELTIVKADLTKAIKDSVTAIDDENLSFEDQIAALEKSTQLSKDALLAQLRLQASEVDYNKLQQETTELQKKVSLEAGVANEFTKESTKLKQISYDISTMVADGQIDTIDGQKKYNTLLQEATNLIDDENVKFSSNTAFAKINAATILSSSETAQKAAQNASDAIDDYSVSLTENADAIDEQKQRIIQMSLYGESLQDIALFTRMKLEDVQSVLNEYNASLKDTGETTESLTGVTDEMAAAFIKYYKTGTSVKELSEIYGTSTDLVIASLKESIALTEEDTKVIKYYASQGATADEIAEKLGITVQELSLYYDANTKQLIANNSASEIAAKNIANLNSRVTYWGTAISTSETNIKELNQTISDLNDGNRLSSDAISDLIDKYPELAQYVQETNGEYSLEKTGLEELRKKYIETANSALEQQIAATDAVRTKTLNRLGYYKEEKNTITDLNDAMELSSKLLPDMDYSKFSFDVGENGIATAGTYNGEALSAIGQTGDALQRLYEKWLAVSSAIDEANLKAAIAQQEALLSSTDYGASSSEAASESSASTETEKTPAEQQAEAFQTAIDEIQNLRDLDLINQEEYQKQYSAAVSKYLTLDSDTRKEALIQLHEWEQDENKTTFEAEQQQRDEAYKAGTMSRDAYYSESQKAALDFYGENSDEYQDALDDMEDIDEEAQEQFAENKKTAYDEQSEELTNALKNDEITYREYLDEVAKDIKESGVDSADATKEVLENVQDIAQSKLDDIKSDYEDAISDIEKEQEDMVSKLTDFTPLATATDESGNTTVSLTNLDEQERKLNKYDELLKSLESKGVPAGLLSDIVGMDLNDAINYMYLLDTDRNLDNYINRWQAIQDKAAAIASEYYAPESATATKKYNEDTKSATGEYTSALKDAGLYDTAVDTGKTISQGIVDGITSSADTIKQAISDAINADNTIGGNAQLSTTSLNDDVRAALLGAIQRAEELRVSLANVTAYGAQAAAAQSITNITNNESAQSGNVPLYATINVIMDGKKLTTYVSKEQASRNLSYARSRGKV